MNKDIRDRWVKVLRSGKYPQIRGRLRDDYEGRCCLGVLCDAGDFGGEWVDGFYEYRGVYCETSLPSTIIEELELNSQVIVTLIDMNDGKGAEFSGNRRTFAEIADYIEQNL